MRRLLSICLLLLTAVFAVHSQQVESIEYWVDNPDRRATGSVTGGAFNADIDMSCVPDGMHLFTYRAQDNTGIWSAPRTSIFFKHSGPKATTVQKIEYWVDSASKKTTGTMDGGVFNAEIDMSGIADGMHLLTYRVQDNTGIWSAPRTSIFFKHTGPKATTVQKIEYWVDSASKKTTGTMDGRVFNADIDMSGIADGMHLFTYRVQDNTGIWSAPRTSIFFKDMAGYAQNLITAYEYWTNENYAGRVTKTLEQPTTPYNLNTVIQLSDKDIDRSKESIAFIPDADGKNFIGHRNLLSIRFKDSRGNWSDVRTDTFGIVNDSPNLDLTGLIVNPNATGNKNGWTTAGSIGTFVQKGNHYRDDESPYFSLGRSTYSSWTSSMTQTINGLPAGTYLVGVKARGHNGVNAFLYANDEQVELPLEGTEGGDIWRAAAEGSQEKARNEGKGLGWNRTVVSVVTDGGPLTIKVEGKATAKECWLDVVDFELVRNESSALKAVFDQSVDISRYKGMKLVLQGGDATTNVTVNDQREYSFSGVMPDVAYTLSLRNGYDQVLWSRDNIVMSENGATVEISGIKPMFDLSLTVVDSQGTDVSDKVAAKWYDANGQAVADGLRVAGAADGSEMGYAVVLGDSLGVVYSEPGMQRFKVTEAASRQTYRLSEVAKARLYGIVTGDGNPLENASVRVKQFVNGKYQLITEGATNSEGVFDMSLPNDTCVVTLSATGFYDNTLNMSRPADAGTVELRKITGKGIKLDLKVVKRTEGTVQPDPEAWYGGIDNFRFSAINLSRGGKEIPVAVQNGNVLLEEVENGDRVEISVSDYDGGYVDASCTITYNPDIAMNATLILVEHGALRVSAIGSDNSSTEYILFDENGIYVKSATVAGNGSTLMENLRSGNYTAVALGKSNLLGMFGDIDALAEAGLKEGTDYVAGDAVVKDALVSEIQLPIVPSLDETSFYYTSDNTSFTVNKTRTIPGSYVTYTVRLEFKEEYASGVDNLSLIVDIPEGMEFVNNSAIIGMTPALVGNDGGKLTIPLTRENYLERLRFCLVPVESGVKNTSAYVRFTSGGDVTQPLGRVAVETAELEIKTPKVTSVPEITVSGIALPNSSVKVYDGNVEIGSVGSKMDGSWSLTCALDEPYNLSNHRIHADITTSAGLEVSTPTNTVEYNRDANHVKTVTMLNTAHKAGNLRPAEYRSVFDFENPSDKSVVYWYWPKYPDFTFIIDFVNNSPERVDNVWLKVKTTSGSEEKLKAAYDEKQQRWIASGKFYSAATPVNVSVKYNNKNSIISFDVSQLNQSYDKITNQSNDFLKIVNDYNDALIEINALSNSELNVDVVEEILKRYDLNTIEADSDETSLPDEVEKALEELINCTNENEFEKKLNDYLTSISLKLDWGNNKDSYLDLCTDIRNGTSFEANGQMITLRHLSPSEFNQMLDDSFIVENTVNSGKIYLKHTESLKIIYDTETEMLYQVVALDNDEDPKKMKNWDFSSYLDKALQIISDYSIKMSDLISETDPAFDELKGFDLFAGGLQGLLSRSITFINKHGKEIGHFTSFMVKAKIALGRVMRLVRHAKEGFSVLNDIKNVHDDGTELGKYVASLIWIKSEAENASKEIIRCLGEERGAPYLAQVQNKYDRISNKIVEYLVATTVMSLIDGANLYQSVKDVGARVKKFKSFKEDLLNVLKELCIYMGLEGIDLSYNYRYKEEMAKIDNLIDEGFKDILKQIDKSMCDDGQEPEKEPGNAWDPNNQPPMCMIEDSNNVPATKVEDPSGYVYEAVTSNRLDGVTASIFEQGADSAPWNAADYSQVNPQITDESGVYAWDVPIGNWQVRFSKPGYDPAATEWLPVPPPQLDVNIPMYHAVNPVVKKAVGYPSGITATFDKYMVPETVTVNEVSVARGSDGVAGELEYPNLEEDPYTGKSFASKVRFVPETPFIVGEEVELHIRKGVKSYADMPMTDDCTLKVVIQSEITDITADEFVTVAPGGSINVDVFAVPAEAAVGQYLTIDSGSSLFSVSADKVKFDNDGKASFSINGDMIGSAPLYMTVEGTELEVLTMVEVATAETTVATPKASIPSGYTVEPGTMLTLSCATQGAVIYYTLDGSCPCESTTKIRYTEPIVIDKNVTIKAQAFKDGLADSNVATFNYNVTSGIDDVNSACEIYVEKSDVVITGCEGHSCRIYDTDGIMVWNKEKATGTQRATLPGNSVYIVNVMSPSGVMKTVKVVL